MKNRVPTIFTLVLLGVVAFASVYGWAFVQLYRVPHSYEAASLWIYENIPAGSKLLGPHWDDRLPVDLPGHNPHQYEYECRECDLPFYEPDNLATLDTLIRRIANGDYIIFPTPRIQGSVPRIPEEYPRTTALLQLLWNGQIGYQIEHVVKAEPRAFGITFNDDLADESFSVYDHPKVTILKNVGRLSPQEIRSKVLNAEAYGPLPSLNQILLTNSLIDIERYGPPQSSMFNKLLSTLLIVVLLAVLGAQLYPRKNYPKNDGGVALSLLFSPLLFGAGLGTIAWVLPLNLHDSAVRTLYVLAILFGLFILLRRISTAVGHGTRLGRLCSSPPIYFGTLAVFVLSGVVAGYGGTLVSRAQDNIIGDLSALFAVVRRASSGTIGVEFGSNEGTFPLVPFLLPLVWPLKVGGVAVPHTFTIVQALCAGTVGALLFRVISSLVFPATKLWMVGKGAFSLILSVVLVQGSIFYVLPRYSNIRRAELQRTDTEVEELRSWATQKITGSPVLIEGAEEASSQLVGQLGLPSFVFRPFGPRTLRQSIKTTLYETSEVEEAYKIASENHIQLIIIGQLERTKFSKESLEKFSHRPDLFAKVYGGKEITIFAPATSPVFTSSF
jgi:hypothetical protein